MRLEGCSADGMGGLVLGVTSVFGGEFGAEIMYCGLPGGVLGPKLGLYDGEFEGPGGHSGDFLGGVLARAVLLGLGGL